MLERSQFVVGDAAWEKIAPLLPGKASDPGRRPKTIGCFLRRCCGVCGRACPGAICRVICSIRLGPPNGGRSKEAMRSTTSPLPLRILIAEAHPIVALGLADLLHTLGYVLVGSVASGQEAILAAGEHRPDLMLVDVDLRGEMDGIAAGVAIHNRLGIRCVFLAEHVDAMMRTRAAEAGPVAILDKTSPMSVIADALRIAPLRTIH